MPFTFSAERGAQEGSPRVLGAGPKSLPPSLAVCLLSQFRSSKFWRPPLLLPKEKLLTFPRRIVKTQQGLTSLEIMFFSPGSCHQLGT